MRKLLSSIFAVAICAVLLVPGGVHAQESEEYADLSIDSEDIFFNVDPLVAGDEVRLYASIDNVGNVDVDGSVTFFQGTVPVGDSQVISVRADGAQEEVYVDFVVPSGSFNIRAQIQQTNPSDENPDNDVAITGLFEPINDADRDGVKNSEDNCPDTANEDQTDTDGDGQGDACDDDDDNDGVSDSDEKEQGTDPQSSDTDGDGVDDDEDVFPNDPDRTEEPPPEPEPEPEPETEPESETEEAGAEDNTSAAETDNSAESEEGEEVGTTNDVSADDQDSNETSEGEFTREEDVKEPVRNDEVLDSGEARVSPNSVFRMRREDWNTFRFEALAPSQPNYRFEWEFGDGVTSNRRTVTHTFNGYGAFDVTLKTLSPDGVVSQDTSTVHVPFFTLENRIVIAILGLLGLLLIAGLALVVRLQFMMRESQDEDASDNNESNTDRDTEEE
jgi:hypothetical protein